jgi:hypothetical protein
MGQHLDMNRGKDLPVVRIVPIKVISQGASSSHIPPQGASGSNKPTEGGVLKPVTSNVSRLHLEKTSLSRSTRGKFKKAWISHSGTGGV